jgi:DNA (cytosine-5)-methyltransferase 1
MDKDRIKALGNAIVPQQIFPFFEAIAQIERVLAST